MLKGARNIVLATALLITLVVPHGVSALGGITVSPSFSELTIEPTDKVKEVSVSITNNEDTTVTYQLSIVDFGTLSESGGVAFLGLDGSNLQYKYGLAAWAQLEKSSITLEPQETQEVLVTIVNKESLTAGGHYGALLIEQASLNENDNVGLSAIPSALFFVSKFGGEVKTIKLDSVSQNGSWVGLPSTLTLTFKNEGNTHVTPRGIVTIKNPLGRIVSSQAINEDSALVLPESIRTITQITSIANSTPVPGWYTIDVSYRIDGTDQSSIAQISFFSFGHPFVAVFVVVSVVCVCYVMYDFRKNKVKAKKFIAKR